MEVFLNGKTPPFFESDVPDLNEKKDTVRREQYALCGIADVCGGVSFNYDKNGPQPKRNQANVRRGYQ